MSVAEVAVGARVSYPQPDPFRRAVSAAVSEHLRAEGLVARGGRRLWAKAAAMVVWVAASYAVLVWVPLHPVAAVLATVSLGLAGAGVGMSVKHDAVHQAFSHRPAVNSAVAHVGSLYGLTVGWWREKHNRLHHGFTNVSGLDDDLDIGRLARLAPDQPWRPWHRGQHVYLWALYPFLALGQVVGADLRFVLFGRVGPHRVAEPGVSRSAVLLADKLAGLGLLVGVALLWHPWPHVLAVLIGLYLVGGLALALTFVVEHTVDTSTFPVVDPVRGTVATGRSEATVRGSANLATHSRLLSWYVGSLNHHIEHHLFPTLPHVQLPRIAPVVRRACLDHGLPYQEFPTLRSALAAHHRFLRALGAPVPASAALDPPPDGPSA
ncbi:MAG TPA: acyl-CoA desaturase [Acidimicrobiales bacterium]|nr:acyl-CoA desaturase [Acidimicrobiales bacterium]